MTRREDGRWQETLTLQRDGRPVRRYFYGRTKAEVLRKIGAYREREETGRSYAEISAAWWEEARPSLAVNTLRGYRPAVRRAAEHFGAKPIRDIKPADISAFLRQFVRSAHAADKTARTQLLVVNQVCKYAVECGDIETNPARDVAVPKGLPKNTRVMPSDADIQRVKDATSCTFGLFAYLVLYTGCRRGEALALTWEDIDFDRRLVYITKSVAQDANTPLLKRPKTEKGARTVPLLNRLCEALDASRGLLFPDPVSGGLMTEMHFQRLWAKYAAESGVSCTPHQLRHAYATMLYEAGVDDKDAQDLLGHAQISTTRDIYTHIREQHRQDTYSKLLSMDI